MGSSSPLTRPILVVYAGIVQGQLANPFGQSIGNRIDTLISDGVIQQVGTSVTKPTAIPEVTIDELEKMFLPFYKRLWFWALVGTAAAGGTFLYYRRRGGKRRRRR